MAGVNHFDSGWTGVSPHGLKTSLTRRPSSTFVATEWSKVDFACVKGSVPDPSVASEGMAACAKTLAGRPRTDSCVRRRHAPKSAFPKLACCGSAVRRGRDNPVIASMLKRRLNAYRDFLEEGLSLMRPMRRCNYSHWLLGGGPSRLSELAVRPLTLRPRFMDTLAVNGSGWAAVVVGANHTADVECSMRRILDHHGYRCDVTVL